MTLIDIDMKKNLDVYVYMIWVPFFTIALSFCSSFVTFLSMNSSYQLWNEMDPKLSEIRTLGLVVEKPLEIAMSSNYHLENRPRNSKLPNLTTNEPFLGWISKLTRKYHVKISCKSW